MARAKKAAERSAKVEPGQIVVAVGQPIGSAELRPAIEVYNGMVAHGWTGRFPANLDAETVRAWLMEHLAFERERASRGTRTRQQRDALRETEATVKADLSRLGRLVNAFHPRGTPGRAAFFPTGKGSYTLGRRLTAMIHGIEQSGLGVLPEELALPTLQKLLDAMPKVTDEATAGGVKTGSVAATREQLDARTREVRLRLTALAQGLLGLDAPSLADFGLAPKSSQRRRSPTKRAAKPSGGSASPLNENDPVD